MASRHPKGLYVLFFTEMWERFGFYTMAALFALYLNEVLKLTEGESAIVNGVYLAAVYFTPFFGGLLADRKIGYSRAVLIGAALLGSGYFCFAHPSKLAFYVSLGLLFIGNGLFKPNISTLVGNLYPQGDPRRDSAFSTFYMGINIGALVSPWVAGLMRRNFGWSWAFASAGFGMVASMIIFAILRKYVAVADRRSSIGAILDVELGPEYEDRDPPDVERRRITALFIMCGIVMLFWMAFHQNGSTLNFWARNNTDRLVTLGSWSWEIPPEIFQAVNPAFIILLTPVVVRLMSFLRKHGLEPSTPAKLGLGMILTATSYSLMVFGSLVGGNTGKVSMAWLIGCYFVITIGELFVSPMGLSMVTKLAPRRMTAMLMGVWFFSTCIGNLLSGLIGPFWEKWPHSRFFTLLVATSLFAAAVLATQLRFLKSAMPPEGPPEGDKRESSSAPAEEVAPAPAQA